MNRRTIFFAAIALALAGCGQRAAAPQGALAGADIGGPFTLVDQDGKTRTDKDFAGKYRLIYFGYTFCPDICPTDVLKMSQGLKSFEKTDPALAAEVQPIFITIDPARDTPKVLKEWVAAFHPRLMGLTGTQPQVDAVLKTFRVFARKAGSGPDYLMDHSAMIYLFDPAGKPIDFLAQDATPADVAAKLKTYVR